MDVAGIVKINNEQFAQVDINGFYPGGAQPAVRRLRRWSIPNQGLLYRLTNNTWSQTDYRALQVTWPRT